MRVYTETEMSEITNAMRAGIESWEQMVKEAADANSDSPFVEIMQGQVDRARRLMEELEDAEQLTAEIS